MRAIAQHLAVSDYDLVLLQVRSFLPKSRVLRITKILGGLGSIRLWTHLSSSKRRSALHAFLWSGESNTWCNCLFVIVTGTWSILTQGIIGTGTCVLSKVPIVDAVFHEFSMNGYPHQVQPERHLGNMLRIDVNLKYETYCNAVSDGGETEWDFGWERYEHSQE